MNQFPTVVVEELDVSVLLRSDGDGKSRVAEDLVDLTGSAWLQTDITQQERGFRPTEQTVNVNETFATKI